MIFISDHFGQEEKSPMCHSSNFVSLYVSIVSGKDFWVELKTCPE